MIGIPLHPTPSAGDGKVIEQSHHIPRTDKLDKMIECAQCGFIVDLSKRSTGGSMGAIPEGSATPLSSTFTPTGGVAETDTYADPVDTNSGCPFCNSMNPRATGRGKNGFDRFRSSLENL
jgi:hypothetical protein